MKHPAVRFISLAAAGAALLGADAAYAYIGPGAGLTAIGTVLALIGGVLLGIVGFVWYPIKRLIRKIRGPKAAQKSSAAEAKAEATAETNAAAPDIATKDAP